MTDEKMLELARQAGFEPDCCSKEWHVRMRKFAALVRREAFEAAASMCVEEMEPGWGIQDKYNVACSNCADVIRDLAAQEEP